MAVLRSVVKYLHYYSLKFTNKNTLTIVMKSIKAIARRNWTRIKMHT